MKLLSLFFICVSAAASSPLKEMGEAEASLKGTIDTLVTEALEAIRRIMEKTDPLPLPQLPSQTVSGDEISLTLDFNNVTVSQAYNFTIDKISNHILGLYANFGITEPTVIVQGYYTASGTVDDETVTGNGYFRLNVTDLVTTGYVKLGFTSSYLQMKTLDIDYTVGDVELTQSGLVIPGVTTDDVQDDVDSVLVSYFKTNTTFVAEQVSENVRNLANRVLKGKSLAQIIKMIENIIDS